MILRGLGLPWLASRISEDMAPIGSLGVAKRNREVARIFVERRCRKIEHAKQTCDVDDIVTT